MKKHLKILSLIPLFLWACSSPEKAPEEPVVEEIISKDSLKEGIPIPYTPIKLDSDTLLPPLKVKAGKPEVDPAQKNVKRISSPDIKLISESLPTFTPGIDRDSPDTVEAISFEALTAYSKPVPASSPNFKDAASYNVQYLDVDQGLSSSYIMNIEEDSRGNLWLSTWPHGVCMYNGQTFMHFNEDNGLVNNYVWAIHEDSKGRIWFGTDGGGLSIYDGNSFLSFTEESNLPDLVIRDIISDEDGNVWFSHREGISMFDGTYFWNYTTQQGLSSNNVTDLHLKADGDILIATDNGMNIWDGESFIHYTEKQGLHSNNVTAVYEDTEENIWVGSAGMGVCQYDGYSFFTFTIDQGLSSDYITDIQCDDYGNIWIGTEYGGLSMYDRNNFTHFTTDEGLSNNNVRCIQTDKDGNLWFGTYGAGINKYNERSFQNFTESSGLRTAIVRDIIESRDGSLWFGHSLGATRYLDNMFYHYDYYSGLSDDVVRAMIEDNSGNIWFATQFGGVSKFDGEYFYHYGPENGLMAQTVYTIFEDRDSNIWFGTLDNGVIKWDGEDFYQFLFNDPETNETCRAIAEDAEGNIWMGTNGGGAYRYDGESMTIYGKQSGIKYSSILSFLLRANGEFWIGTEHSGAFQFTPDTLIPYGTEQGLSNNMIWSMEEDFDGNIWISTEKGLNMLSFSDSSSDYIITQYGKLDGLKGVDFFPNSVCLDNEYRFWWGSGKALTMLDLNKYERIMNPPMVSITDVELRQNFVDYRKVKDSIQKGGEVYLGGEKEYAMSQVEFDDVVPFTNQPTNLKLPYKMNHVTFHFSSIDWSAPHKIRYQYRLDPMETSWNPVLQEDKAVYSNIPEGEYTFMLRAIGEAQEWSEVVEYKLVIYAPWYRTTWAYFTYVLLSILLIIGIIYWRTRQLIDQKKRLEAVVNVRTLEVVQQKEIVERKNKEITDSITYAKRIQEAILPSKSALKDNLKDAFFLYKPKDIVAGDFYWMEKKNNRLLLAAADCTGHGVPGAMVSVVCNNALNRTVREFDFSEPAKILNKVRDLVIDAFDSDQNDIKDGMDIALLSIDWENNTLEYAGANNNLYFFSDGQFTEYRADKQPIGKYSVNRDFTNHKVPFKKGDTVYISTDGYMDQFGGPKSKKFKYAPFIKMLQEIQHLSLTAQKEHINRAFEDWKGDLEQIDDVCVIGVKL